jgi:hypothetical protein
MAQKTLVPHLGDDYDGAIINASVALTGPQALPLFVASVDGAITIKSGIVHITKGSAAALTLAAPVAGLPSAGGDDGKELIIRSNTAFAHTVTIANGLAGAGASADVGTFGAAANNGVSLYAYNGAWYQIPGSNVNVTFA